MKDSLGDRMKENYENRTRYSLMRRAYTIIRVDGKAFHTYTRGLKRPFDEQLIEAMDQTAAYLCSKIQGAKFAYVQSDEISVLLTDFDTLQTSAWFDGNVQKISSVSASMATNKFNQIRLSQLAKSKDFSIQDLLLEFKGAEFDSRVFQVPTKSEAANYFIWRQQDATRNSIQSVAQSLYGHKQLEGKNTNQLQDMIFQKDINWNDYSSGLKRGRLVAKENFEIEPGKIRTQARVVEVPIFTQDPMFLSELIPLND